MTNVCITENIYSTPGCTMLMVHLILFSPNEQNERMSKWAKWTNEQMNKNFYHFYYNMSKRVNEQNSHMSKFGVKWAPEVLIYYKNTPGCIMLMIDPGVPWENSCILYQIFPLHSNFKNSNIQYKSVLISNI